MTQLIPLAFASGLNIYATVAVIGLCQHFHLVDLPEQFRAFDHPAVIGLAIVLYLVEFVADKIPWFDSVWDTLHTVIRPIGGALVAVTAMGSASPSATALAALVGGSIAMTTHVTKAGTRAAVNASPEPFSNWLLSLAEDVVAIGLSYGALKHPTAAAIGAIVLLTGFIVVAWFLVGWMRRRFIPK
jgi:Domain of unknown function (DUF4126)